MFTFVVAADAPDAGIGASDVEGIKNITEKYSPIGDDGKANFSNYKLFGTKAQERIDSINLWLEKNASWLKAVFGMVPSLSWLFALNLWLILFFFLVLVLNGDVLMGYFEVLSKKVDMLFIETRWSNVFGLVIFLGLLATKTYVALAEFGMELWDILWNYILPMGTAVIIIIIILIIVGLIFAFPLTIKILKGIKDKLGERKKKNLDERQETAVETVEKVTKGLTGK